MKEMKSIALFMLGVIGILYHSLLLTHLWNWYLGDLFVSISYLNAVVIILIAKFTTFAPDIMLQKISTEKWNELDFSEKLGYRLSSLFVLTVFYAVLTVIYSLTLLF